MLSESLQHCHHQVRLNSIEASTDLEIAALFTEFFQSTYSSDSLSNSNYPNHLNRANCIFSPVITESSLLCVLETITPTYSPGSVDSLGVR